MNLLLAAPCQLALQDPVSGHSLIGVFHEIKIQVSEDAPEVPRNAMVPREWAVFSKFALAPEEEGRDYSLLTEVFWPDGTPLASLTVEAAQPTKNGLSFIARLQAFPMGQPGIVRIRTSLRSGENLVWGPTDLEILVIVEKSLHPIMMQQ
jgi:hypothetical protein